jgi:cytidylate kinase
VQKNFVITVARGFGSGGKQISLELSERLGIPCYERQILTMASEFSGIAEAKFALVDEKLRGSFFRRFGKEQPSEAMAEPTERKFVSEGNLFSIQAEILRRLADSESCIIVGKAANHVLRNRDNVVSVYIEAPRVACLKSITEKLGVTNKEAARLIEKTDRYRADYFRYYSGGRDWTDPVLYDMTLNSDRIGRERCAALIEAYLPIRFQGQKGEENGKESVE